MSAYTKAEYNEFRKLVEQLESRQQLERISGRLHMAQFVKDHGKEKCDAMFAKLIEKEPK